MKEKVENFYSQQQRIQLKIQQMSHTLSEIN